MVVGLSLTKTSGSADSGLFCGKLHHSFVIFVAKLSFLLLFNNQLLRTFLLNYRFFNIKGLFA